MRPSGWPTSYARSSRSAEGRGSSTLSQSHAAYGVVRALLQDQRCAATGRQDVLDQVDLVDLSPDRRRRGPRLVVRQRGEAVEEGRLVGERGLAQSTEPLDVPPLDVLDSGVDVDREVEEVRHRHPGPPVLPRAPRLQDVETLDDQHVGRAHHDSLAGQHVVGQVRVDGRSHLWDTRLHRAQEAQQRALVVGLGEALALQQSAPDELLVRQQEPVCRDQLHSRVLRPRRQELAQDPCCRALPDRHAAGDPDHERHRAPLRRLAEEASRRGAQPGRRGHVEAEQPRERKVDLLHLGQVDPLAEALQSCQLGCAERQRDRGPQVRPRRAGEVDVRRRISAAPFHGRYPVTMCGIVGYVGAQPALDVVVEGLRRLEYRGYDSAGVALIAEGKLETEKRAGKLANLEAALAEQPMPPATTGIGHTRWATHGAPNDRNAHPHVDCTRSVAVIHNGIIENFAVLRAGLEQRGHELTSETDTEVVAHLLEEETQAAGGEVDLAEALRRVCRQLEGAFTLVVTHVARPDVVVGARRSSPLVVGCGDGENFLASDVSAFIAHTRDAVELGQDQVVEISRESVTITDFDGTPVQGRPFYVDWDASAAEKGGYEWFMLKEIEEQPQAVADTLLGRIDLNGQLSLDEMRLSDDDLRDIDKIIVIACGTAFHAGLIAKYAIEHWTRIPCEVELASEFRYRDPILDRQTLVIAISQSGETMDLLMALRHARDQGSRVLAICNTNGSTIPRESDAVLYTHAGPEVAVASTKGFLTQLVACYLVGLFLAQIRGVKYEDEVASIVADLRRLPDAVATVLAGMEPVRELARSLADSDTILFLGRHVGFPVALEGALKLKELAYIHAEGFAAGELKHGPIAVVDQGTPVVVVVPSPRSRESVHGKVVSNIQEVRARGALTIVIAEEGDDEVLPYADHLIRVPRSPTPGVSTSTSRATSRSPSPSNRRTRLPPATRSARRGSLQPGRSIPSPGR